MPNLAHPAPPASGPEYHVQLELSERTVEGVLILDCKGRILFGEESALLRDKLRSLMQQDSLIVLNLAGINHMDSGGLGTLVAVVNASRAVNARIKLSCLNPRVRDLLEITRLTNFFDTADTVEAALSGCRKG